MAASAGVDRVVRVWDVRTGADVRTFRGHTDRIWCVAFSPDGKRIASASDDRTVKVWNLEEPTAEAAAVRREDLLSKRWLAWHRTEAAESANEGLWSAAAFHLNNVIAVDPKNAAAFRDRATASVEAGQWTQADKDAAKAVELSPDDYSLRTLHTYLRLRAGDAEGYRKACKEMVQCFADATNPPAANDVARLCALLPDALADYDPVVRLAERSVAADTKIWAFETTLAIALYRAGRFEPLVRQLNGAIAAYGWDGKDGLLLAMAHARLDHAQEAQDWLKTAKDRIDKDTQPGSRLPWTQRLELKLLRDEAEALVKKTKP